MLKMKVNLYNYYNTKNKNNTLSRYNIQFTHRSFENNETSSKRLGKDQTISYQFLKLLIYQVYHTNCFLIIQKSNKTILGMISRLAATHIY